MTWSGIQTSLEQALSDVLVLLDCCGAGRVHIGEGNGVTELIAACNYEASANGVGIYSFTHHLVTELRLLCSTKGYFTAADLWGHIYNRMQSHIAQGVQNERYPAPVHFFITADKNFPRSIHLSPLPVYSSIQRPKTGVGDSASKAALPTLKRAIPPTEGNSSSKRLCGTPINHSNLNGSIPETNLGDQCDQRTMLFAIRLEETMSTNDLALEAFEEWFRNVPASVNHVTCKVEAQFESDSTILLVTVPLPFWACIKDHPAITTLGPVKSSNLHSVVPKAKAGGQTTSQPTSSAGEKREAERISFEGEGIDDPQPSVAGLVSPLGHDVDSSWGKGKDDSRGLQGLSNSDLDPIPMDRFPTDDNTKDAEDSDRIICYGAVSAT